MQSFSLYVKSYRFVQYVLLGALALFTRCEIAQACSCLIPRDGCSNLGEHAAVFVGKVESSSCHEHGICEIELAVTERWKGPLAPKIKIRTGDNPGSCDFYSFQVGKEYLVCTAPKSLDVGTCSGTRPVELAQEALRKLKNNESP